MKLKKKILLFGIVILVVLLFVARFAGFYQVYSIPSGSMEPALPVGKMILATNLKSPQRNNIILFTRRVNERFENDSNGKRATNCSRLVAIGGDTLQVKNGFAYVNGRLVDDTTKLKFQYALLTKDLNNLLTLLEIDENSSRFKNDFFTYSDTSHAFLSYDEYIKAKNLVQLQRSSFNNQNPAPGIYKDKNWTVDNFGPYVVPSGHFFVMGDNRNASADSRYNGPLPEKDFKGIMVTKF